MDQANVDARRSLGVRPGARPRPKIQTTNGVLNPSPASDDIDGQPSTPTSPRSPRSPRGIRSPIVSLIVPSGPKREVSPGNTSSGSEGFRRLRRSSLSRKNQVVGLTSNRGQYESQKLLSHLLDRLEARPPPPDLLDRAALAARQASGIARAKPKHRVVAFGEAVAAATMGHNSTSSASSLPPDEDEEDLYPLQEGDWNIDSTYDMVEQMRKILVLSEQQHFDIFGACQATAAEAARTASAKDRRRGSRFASSPLARTGADPFTFEPTATISGPDLLRRMANAVRRLLVVDCLYKTTKFRLLQPPYALQAVCMDIAAVLYHKGNLKIQLEMMEAVVDGLYSMGDVLREKVFEWIEGRLAEMLHKLARERGADDHERLNLEWNDPFAESPSPTMPTFAFSVHPADEADPHDTTERKPGWVRFSPTGGNSPIPSAVRDKLHGILSTHTAYGNISMAAIQIAAIVPHILVAITSTVDLRSLNLVSIYRVDRLLSLIFSAKPDAALDLIEIIAHGPIQSRSRGLDLLASFYPECVGHNKIARRPALATHGAHMAKWESGQEHVLGQDDTEDHSYIPWRVRKDEHILYQEETYQYNVIVQAPGQAQPSKTEVVHIQFSKCIPRLDEKVLGGGDTRGTVDSTIRRVGQHNFRLVNLFNITLCAECHEPLWGATAQGYACMGACQRFYHVACADSMAKDRRGSCRPGFEIYANPHNPPSHRDPFSASAADVRASSRKAADRLYRDPERLGGASYDEVAVLHSHVWMQLEILNRGIASGSLRIHYDTDNYSDDADDITNLTAVLAKYQKILDDSGLPVSLAVDEFARISGGSIRDGDFLWQPRYLQYCAALLRAPSDPSYPSSSANPTGLLTVTDTHSSHVDPPSVAYEAVQMKTIRRTLNIDLNVHSDLAASILIDQLRLLGLCSVAHTRSITPAAIHNSALTVNFPLPLLMDASPSVELLVLVIEQLLDDVDLTANEQGFSLLFNRAWPTSMCAPYALERLGGAAMSWIMAEDDVLHHVVKNYAAKRKRPPGVRTSATSVAKDGSSVAAYKVSRAEICAGYAQPWLKALHDLDSGLYGELAYDRSKVIDDRWGVIEWEKGDAAASQAAGKALDRITALADAKVTFGITLDLLTAWLEDIGNLSHEEVAFKALPRLLRHSHTLNNDSADLWTLANETSRDDIHGLQRVCRWLRVLACSGVDVPWESLTAVVDIDNLNQLNDEARFDIVLAASVNSTPIAHDAHAEFLSRLFANVVASIEDLQSDSVASGNTGPSEEEIDMLRTGMVAILRAYEVKTEDITASALHNENTAKRHIKKKNMPVRTRTIPLEADAVLAAASLLRRKEYPAEMMLDFLWLLLKAPAADNPVGFLHHICSELYESLWSLYDRPIRRRSRARLFLKLLTVNPKPMEALVNDRMGSVEYEAIRERLYIFVLELADDRVTQDVDAANWRRSAVGLVLKLFNTAMPSTDPSPQNLVMWRGLMGPHLEALTLSFENYLLFGSTDEQRLSLLSQLLHLQNLKPSWPILGWKAIEEIVIEQVQTIEALHAADTVHALTAVADALTIRAATLSLGLNMLAAGVPCEWAVLQRFQQFAAAACDLPWLTPCDAITSIMLPALKNILDSSRHISTTHDGEGKRTALVGSLFVPVVIKFATVLQEWDFVVERHILDILLVVFFKHNVQAVQLQAADALRATAHYVSNATNAQNGILAIQVLRTAQERMNKFKFSTNFVPQLFVSVAWSITRPGKDAAFIDSCRSLLQESLSEFGKAGLLLHVLRTQTDQAPGHDHTHKYLGEAVQLAAQDSEDSMQLWVDQLFRKLPDMLREHRKVIEKTIHPLANFVSTLKGNLSEESSQEFGTFISRLARLVSEWDLPWDSPSFDPNPVIEMCAHVLKLTPATCAVPLLHQTSTLLSVALTLYRVGFHAIMVLVPVSVEVARRHGTDNTVATVIFEAALTAVRGEPRAPLTLTSLLAFLAHDSDDSSTLAKEREKVLVEASHGCVFLLVREHPTLTAVRDPEITMGLLDAAATVIVRAEVAAPGNTGLLLSGVRHQLVIVQVHVFGHILYSSLSITLGQARADLVSLYPVLARATTLTMYGWSELLNVVDPSGEGSHFGESVFIVMRLATLAIRDPNSDPTPITTEALAAFWRRLWPEWARLLDTSLSPNCTNDMLRAFTIPLLLDIVLFVASAAPQILVDAAPIVGRGLNAIDDWEATSDIKSGHKLARAVATLEGVLRGLAEPQPRDAIADVRKAMLNSEKIRSATRSREPQRERAQTRMAFR
ncbi:hypothetical protein CspHIS471_0312590 [Cutaneotrichosporon sp. HIS471]|nr:hypothetical protein CspHIS471_0312590 [Cutaneotrichosporon sp. HIS471]